MAGKHESLEVKKKHLIEREGGSAGKQTSMKQKEKNKRLTDRKGRKRVKQSERISKQVQKQEPAGRTYRSKGRRDSNGIVSAGNSVISRLQAVGPHRSPR